MNSMFVIKSPGGEWLPWTAYPYREGCINTFCNRDGHHYRWSFFQLQGYKCIELMEKPISGEEAHRRNMEILEKW